MKLELSLTLDPFGWQSLEARASSEGLALSELLNHACEHVAAQLGSDRVATEVPSFELAGASPQERKVVVDLDRASLGKLDQEAGRQGVGLERMIAHAAIVYLADADAEAEDGPGAAEANDDTQRQTGS